MTRREKEVRGWVEVRPAHAWSTLVVIIDAALLPVLPHVLAGLYFSGGRHAPHPATEWSHASDGVAFAAAERQLQEYASGRRREFEVPIALRGTRFQRAAWAAIRAIPHGETISYGTPVERVGNRRDARAAGVETGRNSISIVVPPHASSGATAI